MAAMIVVRDDDSTTDGALSPASAQRLDQNGEGRRGLPAPCADTGTTKLHRLEENIGAANVALTPDDLAAIAAALATVHGDRCSAHLQARVGP